MLCCFSWKLIFKIVCVFGVLVVRYYLMFCVWGMFNVLNILIGFLILWVWVFLFVWGWVFLFLIWLFSLWILFVNVIWIMVVLYCGWLLFVEMKWCEFFFIIGKRKLFRCLVGRNVVFWLRWMYDNGFWWVRIVVWFD